MFDLAGDDVLGGTRCIANDTENGVIVGFGASAGEDDFLRSRAEERGDLFAGCFHGSAGTLAGRVDRCSVPEVPREIGDHSVEHLRFNGSGGVVIEVDARHWFLSKAQYQSTANPNLR